MIRCQMNSIDSNAPPPPSAAANCYSLNPNPVQPSLLRSKSLNDISNDSQIAAFASDRFINLHLHINNNNNNNNNISSNIHDSYNQGNLNLLNNEKNLMQQQQHHHHQTVTTCMPIDSPYNIYYHASTCNNVQSIQNGNPLHMNNNNVGNTVYGNLPFDNNSITRNLNNNQCSKPTTQATGANVFNLCNSLAMNLNGVTEQIGNLHL